MSAATPPRRGAFSPALMLALILVGVFSFSGFMLLSAFEPELSSGRDGRAHALSQSAVGFAGAVDLARASGAEVSVGRVAFDALRLESLVVLTPQNQLSEDELWDAEGTATLIVLPKWLVAGHPVRRGWVTRIETLAPAMIGNLIAEIAPGVVIAQAEDEASVRLKLGDGPPRDAGSIANLQTIAGPNLVPIAADAEGRPVLVLLKREEHVNVYILSDPDFLNTQGIADIDTARAGMAMLQAARVGDAPIVFDVTLNGLGAVAQRAAAGVRTAVSGRDPGAGHRRGAAWLARGDARGA